MLQFPYIDFWNGGVAVGNSQDEVIIWQSRRQLKRVLQASAVMIVISIVCFFFEGSFYTIAAAAGTCFFGITFIYTAFLYLRPKKLLVMTREGIRDCSMFKELGVIPWDQIADAAIVECGERKYLSLKCVDMEARIRNLPAKEEKSVYRNLKNNLEPVSIVIDMADRRPEEICILIRNKL